MDEGEAARAVIHISPMGNLGNRMIQYLAARALSARAGGVAISGAHFPPFGIHHPFVPADGAACEVVTAPALDFPRLIAFLREGGRRRVDIRTYAQQVKNFLPVAESRPIFAFQGAAFGGTGPDELMINVRQGDILDGHHPDYVLIPPEWYAELVLRTGKQPVFMGQLEPSPYVAALRARFPAARFLPSRGPMADFARLRASRHVVPAISTFSWLAAWLSEAETVFMPVLGLFNPHQAPEVDLLPLDDPRFRFTLFPAQYGAPVAAVADARPARWWRDMPADALARVMERSAPERDKAAYLAVFDEMFYRATYPDVAAAVADGHWPDGRTHYDVAGFDERRAGFAIDRAWYCRTYPMAALEIGQGDAADPAQHWLMLGRIRGYRRGPADQAAG